MSGVYVVRLRADASLEGSLGLSRSTAVTKTYMEYRVEADSPQQAVTRLAGILGGVESYRFDNGVYRR